MNLKKLRQEAGYSLDRAASALAGWWNVPVATARQRIRAWEERGNSPRVAWVAGIAVVFSTTPEKIFSCYLQDAEHRVS